MTPDELRTKFDDYREQFLTGDSEAKLFAANDMLATISRYLYEHVDNIDVWPITLVMAEYAKIGAGGSPEFLKSTEPKGGRPINQKKSINDTSLAVAVEIIAKHGHSVSEALEFVADQSWLNVHQLRQLKKDLSAGRKWSKAKDWYFQQLNLEFAPGEASNYVAALLVAANETHESMQEKSRPKD